MYYGKKKGIIIAIVVIIAIIVLVGVGLFVFLKTDLFKSNETLFYKYLGEHLESYKIEENTSLEELQMQKQQKPYTVTGELTIGYEDTSGVDETEKITELFENLKLTVDGKYDKSNQKENMAYKVLNGTQEIFRLDTATTENIYGVKSDEIVQNAYIGLRNDNLKVFLQKLGMDSSITQLLPDKIEKIEINTNIFKISTEEIEHIQNTYSPVISNIIKENNYSKQNNVTISLDGQHYNCNSYRLDLSAEEIKNLITAILTELQQDSITLNLISTKAKMLGLTKEYTEINELTKTIQSLKSTINSNVDIFEAGLSIVVYENEGKAVATEVIIKNQQKYTIHNKKSGNTQTLNIKIDNLSAEKTYNTININIVETITSAQVAYQVDFDVDKETKVNLSYTSSGLGTDKIENQFNILTSDANISISGNYEENIEFKDSIDDIIELNNTNTAILNDYTKEQLDAFIPAVVQRIITVFNEKLTNLGITQAVTQ